MSSNATEKALPTQEPPTDAPKVALVIVGYRTRDLVKTCLRSLYEHSPNGPFEVCVVDNASGDGTADMIREEFPEVLLIENRRNLGYSRAVNQGFRRTSAPYVLVINPDIVVTDGAVDELVRFMDASPEAGVCGSKLLNPDGTLQYSARKFYTLQVILLRRTFLGHLFPRARAPRDHLMLDWDHNDVREVDWLLGACLMVRRSAAEDVGLMDERFFLYFEDVDLCYRMKQRGWKVVYVPESRMVHHHHRASARGMINRPLLHHLNSVFHFYEKWGGFFRSLKSHRRLVNTVAVLVSDIVSVNLAFFLAYLVRYLLGPVLVKPLFGLGAYRDLILFVNVTTLLAFGALGLYRSASRSRVDEVIAVAKGASVSFLILTAGTFVSQTQFYSRTMVAVFWPAVIVLAAWGRILLARFHSELHSFQFDLRRVVVVGSGIRAAEIQHHLRQNPRLGRELVGTLAARNMPLAHAPILGRTEDLPHLVDKMKIDEVILADTAIPESELADFILKSTGSGVDVRMMTGLSDVLTRTGKAEEFLGVPVAAFERSSLFGIHALVKRGLDVIGALVGLVAGGPAAAVFRILGLVLPGHAGVFRARERSVGLLEGLWKVVLGRMSIVGLGPGSGPSKGAARPGITGLWARTELTLGKEDRALLDAYYLQNWSPGLDLRIILESMRSPGRWIDELKPSAMRVEKGSG